jgi:hypothetical protein
MLSLGGGAVRPRFGIYMSLELFLDAVIPHGRGSVERVGDVLIGDVRQIAGLGRMRHPHAGETVSLQLRADGITLRSGAVSDPRERPEEILDVMPVLVR